MSYLLLHIDTEFIVGAVSADNGNSYPVTNGNDDLLWLYFFNNPHQNRISFGKDNKTHYNSNEVNYYGRFFEMVENEQETFTIRGIKKKGIELLEYSDLLKTIKEKYESITHDNTDKIPTLITFSLSISELAKQKTVEYLKEQGFQIESYTIPLSELTCYYPFSQKKFIPVNGSSVILLAATNSSLHLMKLVFSDNYFMIDGEVKIYKGKGIDPRKRALVKFVVNEINKSVGALSTQDEIEDECARKEQKAEEWLRRIDVQQQNRPLPITESLSIMPNAVRQILVRKDIVESDTGHYIQELMDIFAAFKSDRVQGDASAIFLLGDSFQNSLVRERFERQINKEKLFLFANKDIQQILSVYPKVDFKRYIDQEARSKSLAKAEEQKQAEQRALEDRRRKEQEMAEQKAVAAQKAEENRKEAKKLFDRAVELEKEGKLEDARVNVENAIELDKTNKEYKQFYDDIKDKISRLIEKTELYKKYLSSGDDLLKKGELDKALDEYEAAKYVFDNAEIIAKIIEVKRLIKSKEKLKLKITQLVSDVKELVQKKDFQNAKSKINEILIIDKTNAEVSKLLAEIEQIYKQQEKQFNDFVKSADKYYNSANFSEAINQYKQALSIKSENTYCLQQISNIEETIRQQKDNQEKCIKIVTKADELFRNEKLQEALTQYLSALNLCPQDKTLQAKLSDCNAKIKEVEAKFNDLLKIATISEKKGELKDALETLEDAKRIKPDNEDIKRRIKNIKFNLEFDDGESIIDAPQKPEKINNNDDFLRTNQINDIRKNNDNEDDFLGRKKNNSSSIKNDEDDFFKKKSKKTIDDDNDDFLGRKNKI